MALELGCVGSVPASWKAEGSNSIHSCGKKVHEDLPRDRDGWRPACTLPVLIVGWIRDSVTGVWTEFSGNRRALFNSVNIYLPVFLRGDPA